MAKYLDSEGVKVVWDKIKEKNTAVKNEVMAEVNKKANATHTHTASQITDFDLQILGKLNSIIDNDFIVTKDKYIQVKPNSNDVSFEVSINPTKIQISEKYPEADMLVSIGSVMEGLLDLEAELRNDLTHSAITTEDLKGILI